ncbi:MAG: type IV pilus twitching motility protein PilT [Kiritimatiellia bacterium]
MWTIEELLGKVSSSGGSDLILTSGAPPKLKILGVMHSVGDQALGEDETRTLGLSVLNEAQRAILENKRSVDLSKGFPGLNRFRFNVFYQRGTLALVARLIPYRIPSFGELGLPPIVQQFALCPHGLVLVTGPAGSGKSTTLAAMIEYINRNRSLHVVCLEDPIEYLHAHGKSLIEQREIYDDAPSFAVALQAVFRQSPDVIMVGEMRDLETMQLALTLAETGHLIFGTLHTQDTTHAINRIVDIFPPAHQQQVYTQLSMVLSGIISQTLLLTADQSRRVLACEVLHVNNAIANLIRERQLQQVYSVIQTGKSEGMMTMNESLRRLVAEGKIDQDVALERSPRPRELARMLGVSRPDAGCAEGEGEASVNAWKTRGGAE